MKSLSKKSHLASLWRRLMLSGLIVLLAMPIAIRAQFIYQTNNGAITITGYTGPGGTVTIPDTINGLTVVGIGTNAFFDTINLTSVAIGTNIRSVGNFAFEDCSNLASVTIDAGITNISVSLFQNCVNLTNITIPNTVTKIGTNAFFNCIGLAGIVLPNSITNIANNAFQNCASLSDMLLPTNLTSIGTGVFQNCSNLTSVGISNKVTNIGASAFANCTSLTNIILPGSLTTIGSLAFQGCTSLAGITLPGSLNNFASPVFLNCSSLTAINVNPANLFFSSVAGVLFNHSQTTLVEYPGGLGGDYTIPNSVTNIGNDAFESCSGLTSVIITNSVRVIGLGAFENCTSLTSITNLGSISIINVNLFFGCTSLTNVTIPGSVTNIGSDAFEGCTSLAYIVLPDNLTTIAISVFQNCTSLANITIPGSVKSVGNNAFNNCINLSAIYFQTNAPTLGNTVFLNDAATVYYFTGTSGWGATFGGLLTVLDTVDLGVSFTNGPVPLTVLFSASNMDSASNFLTSWNWDFGDGTTSTDQNPSHTYTVPGSYSTVLMVTNSLGISILSAGTMITATVANLPFTVVTNGNAITIVGYTGPSGAVTIPDTINGLPVTGVGDLAFSNDTGLTSIMIGSGVTNIGLEPFDACYGLTNITVDPANPVYSSLNGVLFDEAQLTLIAFPPGLSGSYTIPDSVTTIGMLAFYGCPGLTSVLLSDSVTSLEDYAFGGCGLTNVVIPNSVTNVGKYAFQACASLNSAYFQGDAPPDAGNAFEYDSVTVYYQAGATGWGATFGGVPVVEICPAISLFPESSPFNLLPNGTTGVTYNNQTISALYGAAPYVFSVSGGGLPPGLSLSGGGMLAGTPTTAGVFNFMVTATDANGCAGSITYTINVAAPPPFTYAINSDNTITITGYTGPGGAVTIPSTINGLTVTSIGNFVFTGNQLLTSVSIPSSLTSIGLSQFVNCASLMNISVDPGNPDYSSINGVLFDKAQDTLIQFPAGLGSTYTVPASVTSIGEEAFNGCDSLTSVIITNSITSIGDYAFVNCASLTSVTLGTNVTSIGEYAFYSSGLTNLLIPNSVTSIDDYAFYFCTRLARVTFGTNLTSIGNFAFDACSSLTTVSIPSSVTSIGNEAFAGCFIQSAYFEGNAPPDNGTAFQADNYATVYYLYGTSGWGSTFGGAPAVLLNLSTQTPFTDPTNFTYRVNGGLVTITGYIGTNPIVVIPDTINGMAVTGVYGFLELSVASVTIGANVTTIFSDAFFSCGGLTNVTFPARVKSIGDEAFENCYNLTSVSLGTNVTSIGNQVFELCTSLTNITVAAANPAYSSVNGVLFDEAQATLIQFPEGLSGSYTIPSTVTTIGDYAFNDCYGLTSLTIDTNATSIGFEVFSFCENLKTLTIPASVTNIGDYAFGAVIGLGAVYFEGNAPPDDGTVFNGDYYFNTIVYYLYGTTGWGSTFGGVPAVLFNPPAQGPFTDPTNFTYSVNGGAVTITGYISTNTVVSIPENINGMAVTSIGEANSLDYVFNGKSVTSVTIPLTVTSIGEGAFAGTTLTNIIIPSSVRNIGILAFLESDLISVNIGTNVTSIGAEAFYDCRSLASVTIPDSVTNIGGNAFGDCISLKSVTLGANITSIQGSPFAFCINLTNITVNAANAVYSSINGVLFDKAQTTLIQFPVGLGGSYVIPASVTTIGQSAFDGCASLRSITIPSGVTSIGEDAFSSCASLTSVTLPDSVGFIGDEAFAFCYDLTTITIPASVTTLGSLAFEGCYNLTSAYFLGNAPPDDGTAFYYDSGAIVHYLNGTTGWGVAFGGFPTQPRIAPGFNYAASTGGVSITGYTSTNSAVVIPDTLFGLPVTGIASRAFANVNYVTSVSITTNVTSIGDGAFAGSGLKIASIGPNVTTIGNQVFEDCASLTNITVAAANPSYSSAGGILFDKTQSTLIQFPTGLSGSYIIPNGITNIGDYSFAYSGLTNVTIPATVIRIGANAFYDCAGLTSVFIPTSVTSIGDEAFADCASLTNIAVDGSNPDFSSGNGALLDKGQITLIQFPAGLTSLTTFPGVTSVGASALAGCVNLTTLIIPDGIQIIGDPVFFDCTNLTSVFLPASVTTIGLDAFANCTKLTNITVDAANPYFSSLNGVLFDKAQATLIQFPAGQGGGYVIPNTVTFIGDYAFNGCSSLTSVSIGSNVARIGAAAFAYCTSLTNITVSVSNPNYSSSGGVLFDKLQKTLIGFPAGLAGSYKIPISVTNIVEQAFAGCNLTSLTIDANILGIGDESFADCTDLDTVFFLGNAPTTDLGTAFAGDNNFVTVYYLSGAIGWNSGSFGGVPTVLWNPQMQASRMIAGNFGFGIAGSANAAIVIEACTNLINPVWQPVVTNVLDENGNSTFTDSQWKNYTGRYYRLSTP